MFYLMTTCTFNYLEQQMGTKCAPPYACLTVIYLEETKLLPTNYQNISMKVKVNYGNIKTLYG